MNGNKREKCAMKPWCTDNLAKWEKLVRNENLMRKTGQKIMTLLSHSWFPQNWLDIFFLVASLLSYGIPQNPWLNRLLPKGNTTEGTYVNMTRHKDIKETLFLQDYFRSQTYILLNCEAKNLFFLDVGPKKILQVAVTKHFQAL